MQLILDQNDLARLKPETLADILMSPTKATPVDSSLAPSLDPLDIGDIDYRAFVDLDLDQDPAFVHGLHDLTIAGLRVIAENGPVFDAKLLNKVEITNYSHFQGSLTKRVRTITGERDAYLLGWDDWQWDGDKLISGRYAVTPKTHRSLREFFGLE